MTNLDFLKEITPKAKITQIGFFTSDIFSAMKNWDELLGVDGWILYKHSDERIQNIVRRPGLCEEKFQFYAACAMLGNTQIELIQPLYGLPFYENFLREHGDGAHHMKLVVPAEHYDQVLRYFEDNGMPVLFGAEFFGSKFYFVDSIKKMGILLEIGNGQFPKGAPEEWCNHYPECLTMKVMR